MMRFSFATVVITPRSGERLSVTRDERRRIFRWAADAGFKGVDLSHRWFSFDRVDDAALLEMRRDIADSGLELASLVVSRCMFARADRADAGYALIEGGVRAAEILGAPVLDVALGVPSSPKRARPVRGEDFDDDSIGLLCRTMAILARRAARANTKIAMELHDDGPVDSAERLLDVVGRIGEPNVGVNPDLGNICRDPERVPNWRAALAKLASTALCWHVKNYKRGGAVELPDGIVDYLSAVRTMYEAGFEGWVSIETNLPPPADLFEVQSRGLDYLRRALANSVEHRGAA
jgi:sugar phosphate isomerase/epimerase